MKTIKISSDEYAKRRKQLLAKMDKKSLAVFFAAPEQHRNGDAHYPYRQESTFYYLTGFDEPDAIAVLAPGREQGEFLLFNRPHDPAKELWEGKRAGLEGAKELYGADQAFHYAEFDQMLPQLLKGRVRRETSAIAHLVNEMRLIKSETEIAIMREAARITAQAHCRAMKACQSGLYEYSLMAELMHEFISEGALYPAYDPIVGSGKNSCTLHYRDNISLLQDGELVLIDAACEYEYYAADVTRTFPINGRFNTEQRAIYEIVLEAQEAAIAAIKPGVPLDKMQAIVVTIITEGLVALGILKGNVDELIAKKAYLPFYMHNSGHWLGLDTHDVGDHKVADEWRKLEPGMVLTVEPGIYIAEGNQAVDSKWWNIGVRIEDDVAVTVHGHDVLSAGAPKRITDIEAMMARN